MILVLQILHHTYVFWGRNTELEPQKKIVRFILRHPVYLLLVRQSSGFLQVLVNVKNILVNGTPLVIAQVSSKHRKSGDFRSRVMLLWYPATLYSLHHCDVIKVTSSSMLIAGCRWCGAVHAGAQAPSAAECNKHLFLPTSGWPYPNQSVCRRCYCAILFTDWDSCEPAAGGGASGRSWFPVNAASVNTCRPSNIWCSF